MKLNPLQQAIIENNIKSVISELKGTNWHTSIDPLGFTPLEIADLLGFTQIQKLLVNRKPKTIKIELKDDNQATLMSVKQFEALFNLKYRPFLTFPSYEELKKVTQNCPYFFRFQWLFGRMDEREALYLEKLKAHLMAKTFIKWIDPVLEYGLFADMDLPEQTFIGEYTGVLREIDKQKPELNAYCFHYPSKLYSLHYYVIDALHEGNELRFINHSDKPNLQPLWLVDKGLMHLVFITNQLILRGSELTFNYGKDYWKKRNKR